MITYLELLELILEGKPPKIVKYGDVIYEYVEELGPLGGWIYASQRLINPGRVWPGEPTYLSEDIVQEHYDKDLVVSKIIEVIEP